MQLKDYQDTAINDLKTKLYQLWKAGHAPARLVFKAPTGSGKTVMAAELLNRISGDAQFDPDKAFIWLSFNPDSVEQSRRKLAAYLNGGIGGLYDTDQISQRGKLRRNDVLFVNWQKLVARNKNSRKLHRSGDTNLAFETFIANTKAEGRDIIVIVDECHLAKATDLAGDILTLIAPRLELLISATPPDNLVSLADFQSGRGDQVNIPHRDVVASGLLKRTTRIMPREEIEEVIQPGRDLDHTILDLAAAKRLELAAAYERVGAKVNPLVLIKLPNDDSISKAASGDDKLAFVRRYLSDIGVPEHRIAVWLTAKKENLTSITDNESPVEYLIFKHSAATGWDCPRADVLVMFREIKSPVFETQVIGRVLRTAEGRHYPNAPQLNDAYLYTSYERVTIEQPATAGPNTPKTSFAFRKPGLANVVLPSVYLTRADYNDLGDSFQTTFEAIADAHYKIRPTDSASVALKKLDTAGLDRTRTVVTNKIIIDADIEVFDDFLVELAKHDADLDLEASRLDLQKLYTTLLWKEIAIQDDPKASYAPARSWSPLKSALNVYFRDKLKLTNPPLYAIICNDLLQGASSSLRPLVAKALKAYRAVRNKENARKAQSLRSDLLFELLDTYAFPEDTSLFTIRGKAPRRYALSPAYIAFDSELEREFAEHLDRQTAIDWWFKNGDSAHYDLGIPYTDTAGIEHVFYPDFIVRQGRRIGILDTKSGLVAQDAKAKAEALQRYIKTTKTKLDLWGGIVVPSGGLWKINDNKAYQYDQNDLDDWRNLAF
ncbi:MAG: DEAD/DEAH box helicase family protein [Hyphomicrobium sp.]